MLKFNFNNTLLNDDHLILKELFKKDYSKKNLNNFPDLKFLDISISNRISLNVNGLNRSIHLNPLFVVLSQNNSLDINGRDVNLFRWDFSDFDDLLDFGDAHLRRFANSRIEIHRRFSLKQVYKITNVA